MQINLTYYYFTVPYIILYYPNPIPNQVIASQCLLVSANITLSCISIRIRTRMIKNIILVLILIEICSIGLYLFPQLQTLIVRMLMLIYFTYICYCVPMMVVRQAEIIKAVGRKVEPRTVSRRGFVHIPSYIIKWKTQQNNK